MYAIRSYYEPQALAPYQETIDSLSAEITHLTKTIQGKEIEKNLDNLANQLELLVDIVNNLKIEDASHSTQIIENISVLFSLINQERIALNNKKRELSGKELAADFRITSYNVCYTKLLRCRCWPGNERQRRGRY